MSCLDNTDILRIVGGNSFQIAITVKARRVSDGSEIEDFDLSASSPVLNLIHAGEKTRKYFVTQGNQAIISFDGSEGLGYYGMEMFGSYDSEAWRFCIEKVLQLVDTNAKANIPEWSVLVDDTYFVEGTISIYGGGGGSDTVQADWAETNPTSAAFILHKPDLSVYATKTEVASGLAGKQDTIVDLTSIRYGAAAGATAYQKPGTGIPESDMSDGVQTSLGKADSAYQKPANGIPATDMDAEVQAALEKANSAVQTETDPVFSNSPAAEITQADINNWNAKQPAIADLADIREGAAAGATAVQPDEMAQAIDEVDGDIADINAKIPTAASNLNQLADKAYVNSSIATNSATYRGSFNLITDLGMNVDATHAQIAGALATAIVTADNNDYAFVQIPDSASTPTVIAKIERYKHNGSGWVYEYDLNNSGFTSAQWAAINSGITSGLVGKLSDLPNNSELATLLNGKQNVINDLSAIRSGAAAGATAVQPADLTEALNGVEDEIAGLDESKQDVIEDLSTIRSGAAAGATAYQKPGTGIPESDMSEGVQSALDKADSAYQKPSSGIPATDMSDGVQAALEKANSAVQTESDPVFSNSPAAEITQADINNWNAKQPAIADLADIREGAAAGATAVQPDEMAQAIDGVEGDIEDINAKIPTDASSLNQLADKAYVNSSIATNSATYRGSFNLITDLGMNVDATHAQIAGALATAIATADNNDYAFVQIPDSASTPTVIAKIERYKHNGSGWVYEYDLNNSGFTSAQWAAINSGITSGLVGKLADLPNNSELATLLNGKQNTISDLSAIRSGAAAGASAIQPADLTEALNDVEDEIAGLDESKQDTIEDLSTIRSGAAAGATAYQKPASGIPESDMSEGVQTSLSKADSAYQKPSNGIPSTDMSEGVQAALEKANSAVQTETDPVFSNSPAAEISQNDINSWNAKQSAIADLADIREGAAAGATAVQPDEMAQAIDGVEGDIEDINAKIPTDASSLNQLADKAYVNSSIATNSATYRGSFNLITDLGMNVDATHAQIAGALATAIVTADNNDYAFVQIPDSASTPTVIAKIERYKHNGSGWVYEYDLNNSGFTAAQWAAINSGITSGLVGKLADLPNNSELAILLNGKQNVINDLATIRSGASAGATAYQKPSSGIPASDMSSTVQQDLSKANTAVQTETDPIFSASPAAGITAQNIQTWNGEPAARQTADTALQAADASLQTTIQDETAARIAADALKVNKADVQDISSVAEPMTSATNPISAHAMGVMKQYVDAEVSQKIITPTNGSVVADNATIESTEVETNVHQFAVKPNVFWTKGTNDVAAEPMVGSDKIVTGDGISRKLGYIFEENILGNGSSWRQRNIFYDTPILAGQTVVLEFSGGITFAGTSTAQMFLFIAATKAGQSASGGNYIRTFYQISGDTPFVPRRFVYTALQDCYIHIDGRWHATETLSVKIAEGIVLEVESVKKNFEQRARGTGMVMHTNTINFNNTTHQAEVGDVIFADPNGNGRLTVPATNVAYSFNGGSTTAVCLVYDTSDSVYKFVFAGNTVWTQIPIAALNITGNSSATPNTSKVNNVFWCACEGWKIDGMSYFELGMARKRGISYVVTCSLINFNNTTHQAEVGEVLLANPTTDARKTISATNVDYSFASGATTAVCFVYDLSDSTYKFVSTGTYKYNQVVIASLQITGNSSATPNSSAVSKVLWSAVPNWQINGVDSFSTNFTTLLSKERGIARVVTCSLINFNNTTHQAEVSNVLLANPNNNNRLTVQPANVDYNFSQGSTTAVCLVYDTSDSVYKFVSTGTYRYNQIVIASLEIAGSSSATPNTSKVVKVFWCAIPNWQINGVNPSSTNNIFSRNEVRDTAVRATGKKAVSTDIIPFSFIHVSDIHTKSNNYKCFENACRYYEHYSNIKAMIVTGDLVWDSYADQMTWYDMALANTTKPVLNVIGNHDAGQQSSTSPSLDRVSTDLQCYNRYIAPYVSNWGVVQPTDAATEGKSYYYKDFEDEKIRLIVVCEFETDYELSTTAPTTNLKYSREFRAMRQAQFDWLIATLSSTPDDYGVIVAYHQPDALADETNDFVSFDLTSSYRTETGQSPIIANIYAETSAGKRALPAIINAFANKTTYSQTFYCNGAVPGNRVINCDFSGVQAEFICILCGHTHRDYIGHLADFPTLPILCVGADNLLYTSGFQPRAEGTPSEDLFNVVNIDRNRKTIKIVRIGSDASVTGQVRDQMIMSYASSAVTPTP